MTSRLRIAVVGLGAAGLAAALAAAQRGADVVGFEQADLDNQAASSGGRGKIIRFGYDDPFYADLMRATLPRWEALAARSGRRLMSRHGGLHIGGDTIAEIRRGIVDSGQIYHEVRPDSPHLAQFGARMDAGEEAVFEPTAGVMWPHEVRAALADAAREAGVLVRCGVPVTSLEPPTAVRGALRTNGEDFDRVILAGGPWAFRLAPRAADAFAITRRFQAVFTTNEPLGDGRPRPWIDHAGVGYYGMLNVAPNTHLAGLHELDAEQPVTDPDEPVDTALRDRTMALEMDYVMQRFGLTEPPTVRDVRACHYTSTATRDFVIDDCPGLPGVTLLSPCSGHGFKFAITVGEYAAALAHGEPVPDRDRFRIGYRDSPAGADSAQERLA
jgi:sarcosine oxidase